MSGFLERITGAAIQRQARLHPVVDSVWAAARRDEAPAFQFPEVTERIVALPQEARAKRSQPNEVESASRAASFEAHTSITPLVDAPEGRSEGVRESTSPRSAAEDSKRAEDSASLGNRAQNFLESGSFQPLLGRFPDTRQENEAVVERDSEVKNSGFAAGYSAANPRSRDSDSAKVSNSEVRTWVYEPVIHAGIPTPVRSADGPRSSEPEQSAPALQAASRRAAASEAAQRSALMRAPIQAEDIQIHIGRIEVIAVPLPAPRPAAAPARRGQTLDEYLSRSNGRPR